MRLNSVFRAVFCAALLCAVPAVNAETLTPGGSVDLLGEAGVCDTLATIDPEDSALKALADCDPVTNGLFSLAGIDSILDTRAISKASASLSYLFDVDDQNDTTGNTVVSSLDYSIGWSGLAQAMSGTASVTILIEIEDLSASAGEAPVVVHELDVTDDTLTDTDSATDTLALELIRGHQYLVSVALATAATAEATSEAEITLADYFGEAGVGDGAAITTLTVSARFDIAELVEQVRQNTEEIAANSVEILENRAAIAANTLGIASNAVAIQSNTAAIALNTAAIASLSDSLDLLALVVAELLGDFESHSHTYLTGVGVGHNNTEATTTVPNGDDDDDDDDDVVIQPLPEQSQGKGKAHGRDRRN